MLQGPDGTKVASLRSTKPGESIMSSLEPISPESLSDNEAVTLLFELASHGDEARERLAQLDAVVYGRLRQAYDGEELPVLRPLASA